MRSSSVYFQQSKPAFCQCRNKSFPGKLVVKLSNIDGIKILKVSFFFFEKILSFLLCLLYEVDSPWSDRYMEKVTDIEGADQNCV